MFKLLEKYYKFSWLAVVLIGFAIFYLSSLSFPPGPSITNFYSMLYHFLAFFSLAFFLLPALIQGKNKSLIFIAIIMAIMYGLLDEIHQLFVPGRICAFSDFLINSAGILAVSLLYTVSLRFRKKQKTSAINWTNL